MSKTKHIYYFDYLRVIAAISVIYMHVAASPLRGDMNFDWHLINFFTCLGFTAVPLFLMMSGHLLLTSEKTLDISVLLKKRLPHLAIPLAGWTVVAVLWRWLTSSDHSLSAIYDGLVSSLSSPAWVHFWYMYSLIAFYLLSPIICGGLRALDKKGAYFSSHHYSIDFLKNNSAVIPSRVCCRISQY